MPSAPESVLDVYHVLIKNAGSASGKDNGLSRACRKTCELSPHPGQVAVPDGSQTVTLVIAKTERPVRSVIGFQL